MPAYKDGKKWKVLFYYVNHKNERVKKQKRGFYSKKEALEWEREFLLTKQFSLEMTFESLCNLYMEDIKNRIKESTFENKKLLFEKKIIPHFKNFKIQDIKPINIREWQGELIKENYSETYIKTINNQITALFNYAVKFYDLHSNPCHKAGSIGKKYADEMVIISPRDFEKVINLVTDEENKMFYTILFWTGMRKGELQALTYEDVDFEDKKISINKNLSVINGKEVVSTPKTEKSKRVIYVNNLVIDCIKKMWDTRYEPEKSDRIFLISKFSIKRQFDTALQRAGVKKMRIHDLRHSHASYLLSNGIDIVTISRRLGHEKVQTTLNTYCHTTNNSQEKLMEILNK